MKKNYEIALDMVNLDKIRSPYNCTANPLEMDEEEFYSYMEEAADLMIRGTVGLPEELDTEYNKRFLKKSSKLKIEKMLGWEVQ